LTNAYHTLGRQKEHFELLEKAITTSVQILGESNSMKGKALIEQIIGIYEYLKIIHNDSETIARNLKVVISMIKKEEELIKKEEAIMSDFERNFMSWLQ